MKKFAATLAASAAVVGTVVLCRRSIDNSVDPSPPNRRRLNVRMHLPLLFGDPKTVDLRCEDKGPCLPPGPVSKVPWSGIQNSQWCNEPLDDKHPAPPLDYTDCEGRQLLHMDNNGGMCAELNKILKVALWAARDHSCFFVDERPTNGSPHFHSHKLGYREDDNGKGFFMPDFMDRYFEHIGLYEDQWNSMVPFPINTPGTVSTDNYDIITPTPGQVKDAETNTAGGAKGGLAIGNPALRYRPRSIPHLGYENIDNVSLKKHFLRRMFRIKPTVRDSACGKLADHGLNSIEPYMALSIRRGDKVTETELIHTVDPYIELAEKAIQSHFDGNVPTMFVATDDCNVMSEFHEARPNWNFVSECDDISEANGFVFKEARHWTEEQTDAHYNKFIAEMIGMASAKYWIGVASTNVSYWVYFMRSLHAHDDSYIFVDKPFGVLPW